MTEIVDCVILGCGPAGAAAAVSCEREGLDWRMVSPLPVEEGARPAETISGQILPLVHDLGLTGSFAFATLGSITRFLRDGKAEPFAPDGKSGLHLDRTGLDRHLRDYIIGMGGRYHPRSAVMIEERPTKFFLTLDDGSELQSRTIVNATGRDSGPFAPFRRNRRLLSPPLIATTGMIETDGSKKSTATRFDSRSWGWIWRTGTHGKTLTWTTLHCALDREPAEVRKLRAASPSNFCHSCGSTWKVSWIDHPRMFAIGDACGHTDPASGQGIANALKTGAACGAAAARACSNDEADTFKPWCESLILSQADQLARYYRERGIFEA